MCLDIIIRNGILVKICPFMKFSNRRKFDNAMEDNIETNEILIPCKLKEYITGKHRNMLMVDKSQYTYTLLNYFMKRQQCILHLKRRSGSESGEGEKLLEGTWMLGTAGGKLSKLTVKEKRPFGFKQTCLPLDILKMFCFYAENSAFSKCVILNV